MYRLVCVCMTKAGFTLALPNHIPIPELIGRKQLIKYIMIDGTGIYHLISESEMFRNPISEAIGLL